MKTPTLPLAVALFSGLGVLGFLYVKESGAPLPAPAHTLSAGSLPGRLAKIDPPAVTEPALIVSEQDARLFSNIGELVIGDHISLPLTGGGHAEGLLNYVKTHPNGASVAGGTLTDGSGTFEIAREPSRYRGFVLPKTEATAYVYSGGTDTGVHVARRPKGEVICEPLPGWASVEKTTGTEPEKAAIYNNGRSVGIIYEPVPILSSRPRAEATIYLDFDGEIIEGQAWEGGKRIVAPAHNLSAAEITMMWQRVSEDFAPFEVNVTTDLQTYLRAPQSRRTRCITTTNNFANAGGVAFYGSFQDSGDTCCWNFYSGEAGALVISHEVGHTFSLAHDGLSNQGYYSGHGSGPTSWGPIMGAPYDKSVRQWSKGDYNDANEHQDDILVIASSVPLVADDHSSRIAEATPLTFDATGAVSNSGTIAHRDDIDAFVFTTGGGPINLQVGGYISKPDLDIELKLYDSNGVLLVTASPLNQLSANISTTLAAGTYTVTVDGTGNLTWASNGYDDYGSLGNYTITGSVASPGWRFRVPVNALAGASVGSVASGGSGFSIIGGNTGGAFSIEPATGVIRVADVVALAGNPSFNLSINASAGGNSTTVQALVSVAPVRGLKQEIFTGLGGNGIAGLTSSANYPNNPALVRFSPGFQTNYNADNYGQKLSGYLLPSESGNHVFWTGADDASELWLSTDANPANKVKIASNSSNTSRGDWTAQASQMSAPINLVAGQRYYIELLHREQTGGEYTAVAWQTPTKARSPLGNEDVEYPGVLANRAPWLANMTFRVQEGTSIGSLIGQLQAGDYEAGSIVSSYIIIGGNTGNAFVLNATTGVLSVNGALSFATLPKYSLDVRVTDSGNLTRTAQISVEVEPRAIKREVWTNVGGETLANLTSLATYPNSPSSTSYVPFFETPVNSADNYGQRLSGYLRAPDSGTFTFWVAADDSSELYLSTDTNPANKRRIAYLTTYSNSREWGKFATQKSASITLEGGKFYYIEVIHKEGTGGDNCAVSWSGPDFGQVILGTPHVTQNLYNHAAPVLASRTLRLTDRDTLLTSIEAKDWADPGTKITFSITAGNADSAFTIDPLTGIVRNVGPLAIGTRSLTITATDNGPTPLSTNATLTLEVQAATLKREVWKEIGGAAVSSLTGTIHFPQSPDETSYLGGFQAPTNVGDDYGQRVSGYLIPPTTGDYTFWIASDDNGELWLSTDAYATNRKRIANVTGSVDALAWNTQTNQKSAVIRLNAGQPYYIETLQKEGSGNDHLAVAWQGPGIVQSVISGSYLAYPDQTRPVVKREFWNVGTATTTPPTAARDFEGQQFSLKSPSNVGDNFNQRFRTFLVPPTTGSYTFWIASDDQSELLLSTDETIANLRSIASVTNITNPEAWDTDPIQKSTAVALIAGQRYFLEVRHRDGTAADHVAVAWQGPGITRKVIANEFLEHPDTPSDRSLLKRELWSNVAGTDVTNLTSATVFPASPSSVGTLAARIGFVGPTGVGDNFGERVSGFLLAPETGRFTFWIASDDSSELYLSSDENPVNKVRIAQVNGATGNQNWDQTAVQKSIPIPLTAGRRYYIEVLHKEGAGEDFMAVAWEGPSFARRVIGNEALEHPSVIPGKANFKREVWTNISGSSVSDLIAATTFTTANPSSRGVLTNLEAPANFTENFGERITATLVAPESGNFQFWVAGDDSAELWLSSDATPDKRMKIAYTSAPTNFREWSKFPTQESGALPLIAGQRYYLEVLHKDGSASDHVSVAWQGPSFPRQVLAGRFVEYPGTVAEPASLKREMWTGIGGTAVSALTATATYPASPNQVSTMTDFEAPSNVADNYGQKISGYLLPAVSGDYQFWIASDDSSELWLSTTDLAINKVRISYTDANTGVREWTKFPSQQSATIALVAGRRYYIEALHKEGGGEDFAAVAWQGPGFPRRIIDRRFLEFPGKQPGTSQPGVIVPDDGTNPNFAFWLDFTGLSGANRSANADPDGDGIPNSLEFVLGGVPSGVNASSGHLLPALTLDPDWAIFEFRRARVAAKAAPFVQYGADLQLWNAAATNISGVQIITTENIVPGIDRVTVKVPRTPGSMFLRLNSNIQKP